MSFLSLISDLNSDAEQIREVFGGKASGLYEALSLNIPIPPTWLIAISHYEDFITSHAHVNSEEFKKGAVEWIQKQFEHELSQLPDQLYAVRSSSQYEDALKQSFAGIFESKLNVSRAQIADAVAEVWDSCFSLRVNSYIVDEIDLRMGVIVQPMIQAKYSGVAFSKHPSPSTVFENPHLIIEFAPHSGDKIVQGEITPFRLSGSFESLFSTADAPWITPLLEGILKLKNSYHHEVDVEFVIDQQENFWLVQQRPISVVQGSHVLDLTFYERKYKRSLYSLDAELLIEGCSLFLAPYLEIPYQMEKWMVMTTGKDGVQELWVNSFLNQAVTSKICQIIEKDRGYLSRIKQRYDHYHQSILQKDYTQFFVQKSSLESRFFAFCEFILPLEAHYYTPMFMIDALYDLLKVSMHKIDPQNAEKDLFKMGTWGIDSLMEIFYEELRALRQHFEPGDFSADLKWQLKNLSAEYGFLKCRFPDERGYTPEDIRSLLEEIPEKVVVNDQEYEKLKNKYLIDDRMALLFGWFREWMRIRNQEMEFLMEAISKSRPLFEEISSYLSVPLIKLWNSGKEAIFQALISKDRRVIEKFSSSELVIYRSYGKTRLDNHLKVVRSSKDKQPILKGKTVSGRGLFTGKVKIAFSIKDLEKYKADQKQILVTGMTTPDFIPYLKQNFSALITDEGGILCHAAIVAREIPIPCIVGTGMATDLLQDGSQISLDFDKGEIIF